jgi:hypothetical protein
MQEVSMRVRTIGAAVAAAGLGLAAAGAAAAQDQPPQGGGRAAVRQACAADIQALCPGIQPGGGRLRECMRQNAAKLSDGCREALKSARGARGARSPG